MEGRFSRGVHMTSFAVITLGVWAFVLVGRGIALAADPVVATGWRSDSLRVGDTWNTFTADMQITRTHVKADGTSIGAVVPEAKYRIERSNRSGNWKTVTTVISIAQ